MKVIKELQVYKLNCTDKYNRIYNVLNHIKYLLDSGYSIELRIHSSWFMIKRQYCFIDRIEIIFNERDFRIYRIYFKDDIDELKEMLYYLTGATNENESFEVRIYPLEKYKRSFIINSEDYIYDVIK